MQKQEPAAGEEKKPLLPAINLPKGGGAIQGMGEKFAVNAVTGTGSASIPVPVSPARNGFAPQLGLAYDSGAGNSPFGLGWSLAIPSIQRKTAKGLPQYNDAAESDIFLLSGAEDLVPFLNEADNWQKIVRTDIDPAYAVHYYRPRTEGLFARIEKWVHLATGAIHWKTTSKENITSWYGRSAQARIYDAQNPHKVFEWLLEESHDNKGSIICYAYKNEDAAGIDAAKASEQHRIHAGVFNQKYLKQVLYGNRYAGVAGNWNFRVVLDYGEHDLAGNDPLADLRPWDIRKDPFSTYHAGFEIRTYRLCRHIMLFHHFPELGPDPVLVRAVNLNYNETSKFALLAGASQTGYIKKDGTYTSKSTPPVEYFYTEAITGNTIHTLDAHALENLPAGVDGVQYNWVDLEGEGIDGILTEQAGAWFYKANLGNGNFAGAKLLAATPSLIGNGRPQLQDIDADGEKELVVLNSQVSGYYAYAGDDWKNYRPFTQMPNLNWQDPNLRFLDLNGDGFADILITGDDELRWFPSKAKQGYEAEIKILKSKNEADGPALIFADPDECIYLADMSGGGLMDIVRIRNQSVCYWPNLGYGKFGAKISMDNAPLMDYPDQFNQRNIRLTDIDGSGTTDILYIGGSTVKCWINEAGNGWSDEKTLPAFPVVDHHSVVQLADLLGKGTPCLVWSSSLPGNAGRQMKYIDLMEGGKPYLMNRVVNNMGREDIVEYLPSTHYYLQDKLSGKPWITKLPFPVYVVARTETRDLISGAALAVKYTYHHGYYDSGEREFRGFGMVEQQDEEVFGGSDVAPDHVIPPVLTKTWYHTGAYVKAGIISQQYKTEYYQLDGDAYLLPDSTIEERETLDYTAMREACRALRGQVLRTEVYSLDNTEKQIHPYTVSESNAVVKQLQPHEGNKFAVYLAYAAENFSYYYDRCPADPRMSHTLTLEVDKYGNPVKTASVVYPRRNNPGKTIYPEQQQLHVLLGEAGIIHLDDADDFYLLGIPAAQKSYEVTGIAPAGKYFTLEELDRAIALAATIKFSDIPNLQLRQKRLLSWARNYYWNNTQAEALPNGEAQWPVLPHHAEAAVFTPDLISQVYGDKLTEADIAEKGKYIFGDEYWWAPAPVVYYLSKERFYYPYKTIDAFAVKAEIVYDAHDFVPTGAIDNLGNETGSEIDYRVLSPWRLTDVNGTVTEALTDALGMVMATTIYGKEEDENGNIVDKGDGRIQDYEMVSPVTGNPLDDIVANPANFLQDTSTYFYYDIEAWYTRQQPPQFISLAREIHVSDLQAGEVSPIHIALGYSDGFGRSLQQKVKVEPGIAYISDADGGLVTGSNGMPRKEHAENRWLSSGRTVYNNKQKPYKQYEPFYISGYAYEKEKELTKIGVTPVIHYDPMMRVIRTDVPKGFFTKVEFDAWEVRTYDVNDTVMDSDYWQANYGKDTISAEEQTALEKAGAHYDTPAVGILDSLGRGFMAIAIDGQKRELVAYTDFDITGNPLTQTDPRQYELNKARIQPVYNFTYIYDMSGSALHTSSMDAGVNYGFVNAAGNPLFAWTSRGYKNTTIYDGLHRPLESWCAGNELTVPVLVEKLVYGTSASGLNKNMQPLQYFDQTGLIQNEIISFKGEILKGFKQFCKKYTGVVNWDDINDRQTEEEKFYTRSKSNALGRVLESISPDGSITKPVFNFSGQLKKVQVKLQGTDQFTDYVKDIVYTEKGQRDSIHYGNDTATAYTYEEQTYRLKNIRTTRKSGAEVMQDLHYWQDPAGNITAIQDAAQEVVYYNGQEVWAHNEYTYDAFYQLIFASGREHSGQSKLYTQFDEFLPPAPDARDAKAMRAYTQEFFYDDAGNKTWVKHKADNNNWNRKLEYDEDTNRLQKTTVAGSAETFTYDAAGNMLNMATADMLQWDYKNQLAHVARGTTQAWYNYDAGGQRCRKVVEEGGKTKVRYYLGNYEVYREYKDDALVLERQSLHVSDDMDRIALVETKMPQHESETAQSLIRYQYNNHLGSTSLELDDKAAIISYEEYYPYGNTSYQAMDSRREVPARRYRYTGMERDEETGLNYHTARYYAPWLGRWLSPDPAGTVDGLNVYLYVRNNPINLIDVSGEEGEQPRKKMVTLGLYDLWDIRVTNFAGTILPPDRTIGLMRFSEWVVPNTYAIPLGELKLPDGRIANAMFIQEKFDPSVSGKITRMVLDGEIKGVTDVFIDARGVDLSRNSSHTTHELRAIIDSLNKGPNQNVNIHIFHDDGLSIINKGSTEVINKPLPKHIAEKVISTRAVSNGIKPSAGTIKDPDEWRKLMKGGIWAFSVAIVQAKLLEAIAENDKKMWQIVKGKGEPTLAEKEFMGKFDLEYSGLDENGNRTFDSGWQYRLRNTFRGLLELFDVKEFDDLVPGRSYQFMCPTGSQNMFGPVLYDGESEFMLEDKVNRACNPGA